jgi:multidrug efflux pump subunit AcrA (membrane-fusion protein)
MIRKLSIVFFLFLLIFTTDCTRRTSKREQEEPAVSQKKMRHGQRANKPAGEERPQGQSVQVGKRRLGRRWGKSDLVRLSAEEAEAVQIDTVLASYKSIDSELQAMGKVLAHQFRKAIVSYAFPARIAGIQVRTGDWVKPGQELVTLQSEEVGNAKSEYYKARADFELASSNYERSKRLFDRGAGAQKNLLTSAAELKVAETNLDAD